MINRVAPFLLAGLLSLLNASQAQAQAQSAAGAEFHTRVTTLYSFQPHKLDKEQIIAKSAELDTFWEHAKANAPEVLPLLRDELANPDNPSFFAYDGAKLLLSLSEDKADRELALRALPRVDLKDVNNSDYLVTMHWFARNGFDTREAALRILDFPEFKAFIPQHSLTLGQNYALIYMLFPLQDIPFEQDLITRLETERDARSQMSLLLALWYTATPAGHAALKGFSEKAGLDAEVAKFARRLLERRPAASLSLTAVKALREERARVMQRPISDEALMEFDSLTTKLLAKQGRALSKGKP
ncbi:MAG: hypothetical protein K0S46_1880 [Moraxellaceae bacterium]|nr:hypothetical protein [Moraxellaceae bacterium]